jgi:glycosyltransferase involved in cell wall biosynthesis
LTEKKIKVLECIRQGQIGGGESHLLSLVENLNRSHFEPVVLSFTDGPMIDRLNKMGIENHVIPSTKPFDITKWKKVKDLLAEKDIRLVHAHGTRANSNILWAAKQLKLPVIYTVHGWSFHQDQHPLIRHLRILGEKYLVSRSDLNISVSASNQQTGKQFIPSFKSVVVNNGIDRNKFNPAHAFKDIRKELGIDKDAILVLFIARFTAHKQPLALMKAFMKAFPSNQQLHLLMVGDGDQKATASVLLKELHAEKQITLLPFRQDVPDLLAAADIFVLPSLWEGLPIGLLEAMSMGKAVIASKVDGTVEIVSHEVNGWLVDTQHLEENLSTALIQLSKDPEKRKFFSRNAMATVNNKYNAADMTRSIEDLYEQVLHAN